MKSHTPVFRLLWESPRPRLENSCTTCGNVTDRCCAMKSPIPSPIPPTWKTRSATSARRSPPEPTNSMKNLNSDDLSNSLVSATKSLGKCQKCGATTRLEGGVCVSCLLREGLEAGVSRAEFEGVMAEVNVPDTEWHLGNY